MNTFEELATAIESRAFITIGFNSAICAAAELVRGAQVRESEDAARYRALNTPEIHDFISAVEREALHQRDRWGADSDAGKTDADWFWLIGHLAGKAMSPATTAEKKLHHVITTAAACLNWHAALLGAHNEMRPGAALKAQGEAHGN